MAAPAIRAVAQNGKQLGYVSMRRKA